MRSLQLVAVFFPLAIASTALAGFMAQTGTPVYDYSGTGSPTAPAVGDTITVTNQPLQSYDPDTSSDPQIQPNDIGNYLFSLDLTVNAVVGDTFRSAGTYSLFYDLGSNGTPDIRVSSGNASLYFDPSFSGFDGVTGVLAQTEGPANSAFADLAYGNDANTVLAGGYFDALGGNISLTLRQNATSVPEPASLGAAGVALLAMLRRRRA